MSEPRFMRSPMTLRHRHPITATPSSERSGPAGRHTPTLQEIESGELPGGEREDRWIYAYNLPRYQKARVLCPVFVVVPWSRAILRVDVWFWCPVGYILDALTRDVYTHLPSFWSSKFLEIYSPRENYLMTRLHPVGIQTLWKDDLLIVRALTPRTNPDRWMQRETTGEFLVRKEMEELQEKAKQHWIVEIEVPWAEGVVHVELHSGAPTQQRLSDLKQIAYDNYAVEFLPFYFKPRNTELEYKGCRLCDEGMIISEAMGEVCTRLQMKPEGHPSLREDIQVNYFRLIPTLSVERAMAEERIYREFLVDVPWSEGYVIIRTTSDDTLDGLKRKVYAQFRFLPSQFAPSKMIFYVRGRPMLHMLKTFEELGIESRELFDLVPADR